MKLGNDKLSFGNGMLHDFQEGVSFETSTINIQDTGLDFASVVRSTKN